MTIRHFLFCSFVTLSPYEYVFTVSEDSCIFQLKMHPVYWFDFTMIIILTKQIICQYSALEPIIDEETRLKKYIIYVYI